MISSLNKTRLMSLSKRWLGNWQWIGAFLIGIAVSGFFAAEALQAQSLKRLGANRSLGLEAPGVGDMISFVDRLTADGRQQDSELTLQKIQANIAQIRSLLREKPSSSAKMRLLRRLADLYIEQGNLHLKIFAFGTERNTIIKSFDASGVVSPESSGFSSINSVRSTQSVREAVAILRELSQQLSASKIKQDVDFDLGLALLRLESPDAYLYLDQAANQGAKSQFSKNLKASIAQLALAEHLVSKGKVKEAFHKLKELSVVKSSLPKIKKVVDYSRFRLAWLGISANKLKGFLNVDDVASMNQEDENIMVQLALISESKSSSLNFYSPGSSGDAGLRSSFNLAKESCLDLAQIWALQGKDQVAQAFFTRLKDNKALNLFWITYGNILYTQGNYPEASVAFSKGNNSGSLDRLSFLAENFVIKSLLKSQQHTALVRTKGNMFLTYGPKGAWFQKTDVESDIKKLVSDSMKLRLKQIEEYYVVEAQKTDDSILIDATLKILDLHKMTMPQDPNLWRVNLASADLLAKVGRNEEAVVKYLNSFSSKNIDLHSKFRVGRRMVDLKLSTLPPNSNVIQMDVVKEYSSSAKTMNQSASVQALVEVIDRYSSAFPKEADIPRLKFLAAVQLLNGGQIDKGLKLLDEISRKYAQSPESYRAIQVYMEIHRVRQNFQGLVAWSIQFLKRSDFPKDSPMRGLVSSQFRDALWAYTQQLVSSKKDDLAAKNLQLFQEKFPTDPFADQALVQMLELFINRGFGGGAVMTANKLISLYPDSQYRKIAMLKLADVYIQQAQFENAGNTLVNFSKRYPTDPRSPEVMLKGIAQYEFAENIDMVRLRSQEFSNLFPQHSEALAVEIKAADILEKHEDYGDAIKMFLSLASRYERTFPEEAVYAKAKAAVLTLKHFHESTGRQALNVLEKQFFPVIGYHKAKEVIAAQKLYDLKMKSRQFQEMATIKADSYASYISAHLGLMRQISDLQKSLASLIPISDTKTKVGVYMEIGSIFDRVYRLYLMDLPIRDFSQQDKFRYFKQREEVLSLARQQCLSSWQEGVRLSKLDSTLFEQQKQLTSKLSKLAPGTYSDFNEEFLDAKFVSHKFSKN